MARPFLQVALGWFFPGQPAPLVWPVIDAATLINKFQITCLLQSLFSSWLVGHWI